MCTPAPWRWAPSVPAPKCRTGGCSGPGCSALVGLGWMRSAPRPCRVFVLKQLRLQRVPRRGGQACRVLGAAPALDFDSVPKRGKRLGEQLRHTLRTGRGWKPVSPSENREGRKEPPQAPLCLPASLWGASLTPWAPLPGPCPPSTTPAVTLSVPSAFPPTPAGKRKAKRGGGGLWGCLPSPGSATWQGRRQRGVEPSLPPRRAQQDVPHYSPRPPYLSSASAPA